jgi:hypothetical protein
VACLDIDLVDPHFAHLAEGNARQARSGSRPTCSSVTPPAVSLSSPRPTRRVGTFQVAWSRPTSHRKPARFGEELGLVPAIGRPLVVEWVGAHGPWDDQILFVFDGGVLSMEGVAAIEVRDPRSVVGSSSTSTMPGSGCASTSGAGCVSPWTHSRPERRDTSSGVPDADVSRPQPGLTANRVLIIGRRPLPVHRGVMRWARPWQGDHDARERARDRGPLLGWASPVSPLARTNSRQGVVTRGIRLSARHPSMIATTAPARRKGPIGAPAGRVRVMPRTTRTAW